MSFITRWFRRREPEDYEQILAALALDIQKRQTRLSEIRLRERRATLLATMYTLAFWTAYVTMWYTNVLPNLSGYRPHSALQKFVKGVPVLVGPIVILFTRRIVQIWYSRIGDAEEKTLVTLNKQRHDRIEEIKKKTGYYTTRNLLERYDDSPGSPTSPLPANKRQISIALGTPMQQTPQKPPETPNQLNPKNPLAPIPQQPIPPPRKQWYDKLADAILGDEDAGATPASRYALICQKCFAHNGLVKESLWANTQYVCPKCGHFNPSPRSLEQPDGARQPRSGQKLQSASPQSSSPKSEQRIPSNQVNKRRRHEVDEGNSTAEMDIDS